MIWGLTVFHQGGVPPHILQDVRSFLVNHYPSKWIDCSDSNEWPPSSPDLILLVFTLYGCLWRTSCMCFHCSFTLKGWWSGFHKPWCGCTGRFWTGYGQNLNIVGTYAMLRRKRVLSTYKSMYNNLTVYSLILCSSLSYLKYNLSCEFLENQFFLFEIFILPPILLPAAITELPPFPSYDTVYNSKKHIYRVGTQNWERL